MPSLVAAFPRFTVEDWRAAVAGAKSGAGDATALAAAIENHALFARKIRGTPIAGRLAGARAAIIQRSGSLDAAVLAEEIAGGANGVDISLPGTLHPLGPNIAGGQARATFAAIADTLPDGFTLRIDAGGANLQTGASFEVSALYELAAAKHARLVFTFDPVAAAAMGRGATSVAEALSATADALDAHGIEGAIASADGRIWHAAGATEEQELAAVLATYVAHLRAVPEPGRIEIELATDADQFRSMAKLRAMRLLAARVSETSGLSSTPRIHAETAWRMMSAVDTDTNILRTTVAAFAAIVGGADSLTVLPHDCLTGSSVEAARLARNTQIILTDEANLHRVADPAAGSGALEALTGSFAEGAWRRFQRIETEGGILAALAHGELLNQIAEAQAARLQRGRSSSATLVGVNAYRANGQASPKVSAERAPIGRVTTLTLQRLSEDFE